MTLHAPEPLVELAGIEDPPVELEPFLARLRQAGATEVYVASETPGGALIEVANAEVARVRRSVILVRGHMVVATQEIEWQASDTPLRDALERVVTMFQGFDKVGRFRFAASDMRLVAGAAGALIDAYEKDGPARLFDRVLETGMVVTYVRPFLESNEAGVGRTWWPQDVSERELHDELVDLRSKYHAHAAHTPQRFLDNAASMLRDKARPVFLEAWTQLPTEKLRALEELAARQAERFKGEADRLDVEFFGPRDDDSID